MSENLHFVQYGAGPGSPLVLLHGFGGSGEVWAGMAVRLGEGRRVICFDLPGHGGSVDCPKAGPAKTAVRTVLADLETAGIARFHLAGHSFAGAVATLIALSAPQAVASLTLLAPGGFGPQINARLLRRFAAARDAEALRQILEAMYGFANPLPDAALDMLVRQRSDERVAASIASIGGQLFAEDRQGEIPRDGFADLPMPVKVLWGDQDAVLPASQLAGLPSRFALHRFADTGHMLIEEKAEDVAMLIEENMRAGGG